MKMKRNTARGPFDIFSYFSLIERFPLEDINNTQYNRAQSPEPRAQSPEL